MQNARLDEAQAGIKIARGNINNLRYVDTTLTAEREEELKASWWRWQRSEKAGLKLNIQKTKIMVSGPIILWHIDGETMETVTDFIYLGSKITVDSDCSHEIKILAPWNKSYDKPRQHIKNRSISLLTKASYSQSYAFSEVMYRCWQLDHKEG